MLQASFWWEHVFFFSSWIYNRGRDSLSQISRNIPMNRLDLAGMSVPPNGCMRRFGRFSLWFPSKPPQNGYPHTPDGYRNSDIECGYTVDARWQSMGVSLRLDPQKCVFSLVLLENRPEKGHDEEHDTPNCPC